MAQRLLGERTSGGIRGQSRLSNKKKFQAAKLTTNKQTNVTKTPNQNTQTNKNKIKKLKRTAFIQELECTLGD